MSGRRNETKVIVEPGPLRDGVEAPLLRTKEASGGQILPAKFVPGHVDVEPTIVSFEPGEDSISGPQLVTSSAIAGAYAQLSNYKVKNGVPRKMTLVVTQTTDITTPGGLTQQNVGLYVKVTIGTRRGAISQWIAAPCVFPLEGSYVRVEGFISGCPFTLQSGANESLRGTPPTPPNPVYQCRATSLVIDGWTDEGPAIVLATSVACNALLAWGPVIVDTISFTNTNATAGVLMVISDTPQSGPALVNTAHVETVYVPAQSTVSVGKALLGTFAQGVYAAAIVAPPSGAETLDANGANVYATVRGRYLLVGTA